MAELHRYAVTIRNPTLGGGLYKTKTLQGEHHYVEVPHEATYSIELKNNRERNVDATVHVDGSSIGTFRLSPYGRMNIERPSGVNKAFVFTHEDKEGADAGLKGKEHNGLITVDFVAESAPVVKPWTYTGCRGPQLQDTTSRGSFSFGGQSTMLCSNATASTCAVPMSSGYTALGDATTQSFQTVPDLKNIDESSRARISLRLVGPSQPEPRIPLQKHEYLTKTTSTPPRIDAIRC